MVSSCNNKVQNGSKPKVNRKESAIICAFIKYVNSVFNDLGLLIL